MRGLIYLFMIIKLLFSILSFESPIDYVEEEILLGEHKQHVHTLDVDMNKEGVVLQNALSFGSIYGFQETSAMVAKAHGKAGVNGMFYTIYGHHIGLMIKSGELISLSRPETPSVAVLEDNRVYIGDIETNVRIEGEHQAIQIATMNDAAYEKTWVLYTRIYGKTTRIERPSVNYVIADHEVKKIIRSDEPVTIPQDGVVLSYVGEVPQDLFQLGEQIKVRHTYTPDIGPIQEAFQSGGWLVRDGKNVAKEIESYMGNTNIPNPRTLFGVTADNRVIVKVVDGRQKNSYGITGKEAAKLMLEASCIQAVYLDGGASSTMVVDGQVVNSPSSGQERKVAHSIIFDRVSDKSR